MSDFKTLKGLYIKHVSSDPSNLIEGQIWYNTSTQTIKVAPLLGAVASGGNLNTATRACFSAGTQTAALKSAGANPGTNYSSLVEEYDGSSWTEVTNCNTARDTANRGLVGTQTSSVIFGGNIPGGSTPNTETYDGTNWTETGNLSTGRGSGGAFGTQTAAVCCSGTHGGDPYWTEETEEFDGSSWTAGGAYPRHNANFTGVGTLTAGLGISGSEHPSDSYPGAAMVATCKSYDGSSWSSSPAVNTGAIVGASTGTQTAALFAGGSPPHPGVAIEEFDGSSWTALSATLSTATGNLMAAGTTTASVFAGGQLPGNLTTTQEFTKSVTTRSVDTT